MSLKDGLLAEYDHEMGTTRRLLERVPDDRLGWKPHEKSMALGELASHLGNIPHWGSAILKDAFFDLTEAPPNRAPQTSRAGVLSLFDSATSETRQLMDRSDAEYVAKWTLKRGSQVVFVM